MIPNDFKNAIAAINFGEPVVLRSPKSEISPSLIGLGRHVERKRDGRRQGGLSSKDVGQMALLFTQNDSVNDDARTRDSWSKLASGRDAEQDSGRREADFAGGRAAPSRRSRRPSRRRRAHATRLPAALERAADVFDRN